MARPAAFETDAIASPLVFLWSILVFLALVGFVGAILGRGEGERDAV